MGDAMFQIIAFGAIFGACLFGAVETRGGWRFLFFALSGAFGFAGLTSMMAVAHIVSQMSAL